MWWDEKRDPKVGGGVGRIREVAKNRTPILTKEMVDNEINEKETVENRVVITHTCLSTVVSQDHTKLNSTFISNCIINLVSEDPVIPIKALVKEIVSRFGYTVTYRKVCIAKQLAMSQIYGD
ncbi:hypothetical protein Lal_00031486 [Lupinus albus]|nr:hypothetical protein Lal_00031486 [Lupinus albus]